MLLLLPPPPPPPPSPCCLLGGASWGGVGRTNGKDGRFEPKVFYYGLLTILRRTLFVLIAVVVSEPMWQSSYAIFLVAAFASLHLKLEPYKTFVLDQLDFVLMGCLCVVAVSSLAFQLGQLAEGMDTFRAVWEAAIYTFMLQ